MSVAELPMIARPRIRARLVAVIPCPRLHARRKTPLPSRRRARVSLLVALLAFIGVQVLTNHAIRSEWCPVRDPLYFDKLALFQARAPAFFEASSPAPSEAPPVRVMFVGSSRTQNAVDTGALQAALTKQLDRPVQAFNFALAGCGPVTDAVYLRRLVADGVKPDFVLLEIHPVFLAGQRPDPPETRWLLPIRLRPEELPFVGSLGFPSKPSGAAGWRGWLASWYEYRFILVDRYLSTLRTVPKLNDGHEPDAHGFVRAREVNAAERVVLEELTRRQYQDYFPDYRPNGPGVAAMRDMLETCRANGWKGAIFLPPESAAFRGWYAEAGRLELETLLKNLAAEYGVPVIDARTWLPDDLIADGHHLSGSGADALTARLARESLAPWIAALARPATPRTP